MNPFPVLVRRLALVFGAGLSGWQGRVTLQDKEREPVKRTKKIPLTSKQLQALSEIKRKLVERFDIEAFVLYGSVARGQATEESDADLLIVTSKPLTRFERHEITNVVFEVNL